MAEGASNIEMTESIIPYIEQYTSDPTFDYRLNERHSCDLSLTQKNEDCVHQYLTWPQKATTLEDWETYLYSNTNHQANNVAYQERQIQPVSLANPNYSHFTKSSGKVVRSRPRAHISFVHTSDGGFKPMIIKRKRKRTMFTTEQVTALEKIFYKKPYVTREERHKIMEELQVSDKAIKIWFQNRRLKEKREREEQDSCPSDSSSTHNINFYQTHYVENQMCKVDNFGYVALDDRALVELAVLIDNALPKDINVDIINAVRETDVESRSSVSESESSVIYEPISPPDLTDDTSEEKMQWDPFEIIEPKQSFQRVLDVHACMF